MPIKVQKVPPRTNRKIIIKIPHPSQTPPGQRGKVPLGGPTLVKSTRAKTPQCTARHGMHWAGEGMWSSPCLGHGNACPHRPNSPDALKGPQSCSEHRPSGTSAAFELRIGHWLPKDAIPQSWRYGRGRLRTSTSSMPPAPMGGTRHLETVDAPQTPAYEGNLVLGIRLQSEKRGNNWHNIKTPTSSRRLLLQFGSFAGQKGSANHFSLSLILDASRFGKRPWHLESPPLLRPCRRKKRACLRWCSYVLLGICCCSCCCSCLRRDRCRQGCRTPLLRERTLHRSQQLAWPPRQGWHGAAAATAAARGCSSYAWCSNSCCTCCRRPAAAAATAACRRRGAGREPPAAAEVVAARSCTNSCRLRRNLIRTAEVPEGPHPA